jgi:hypothetical protein
MSEYSTSDHTATRNWKMQLGDNYGDVEEAMQPLLQGWLTDFTEGTLHILRRATCQRD